MTFKEFVIALQNILEDADQDVKNFDFGEEVQLITSKHEIIIRKK